MIIKCIVDLPRATLIIILGQLTSKMKSIIVAGKEPSHKAPNPGSKVI